MILAEVGFRVRYGAPQVRSFGKFRVNLYRRTPPHDCDSSVGVILRETTAARECIDYAHVQVSCCGFVSA